MIKFLIGGSPCTHWSIAQSKARETEPEGIGWELFKNYLIAKEKFSPDFFLYENNKSASQPIKERISVELGVPLQYINSALVSAQNRWRFYAHNIGDVPQPEDRGIMLIDILESVTGSEITPVYPFGDFDGKSYCLTSNYHKGSTIKQTLGHHKRTLAAERIELPAYAGRVVGRRINAEGHQDDYNHDLPHIQRFEVNNDPQKTNTISTVEKDNMIAVHVDGTSKQYPVYEVSGGFITYNGVSYEIALPDGYYIIRIAVCNTPDTEKVIISSGAAGEIELTMHIEISNADAISFIIDPNVVTATKKDIEDHDASKTAHAAEFEKKADVTDLNAHANNTDIHVNPSTMGNYDTAISGLIEHKEDTKIHVTAEEKASWTEGAEQAAADANRVTEALNAIAGIESRVSRVEDGLFNNITGNPFLASFDSLDGITLVKGIWNEERKRIEC